MIQFILKRLLMTGFVLLGVCVITFALTHVVPGNPARLLAGQHATAAQVTALAAQYGLDKPVPEQFWIYVTGLFHGDLGMSLTYRRPVLEDLRQFLPASIELTLESASACTAALACPMAMLSPARRNIATSLA